VAEFGPRWTKEAWGVSVAVGAAGGGGRVLLALPAGSGGGQGPEVIPGGVEGAGPDGGGEADQEAAGVGEDPGGQAEQLASCSFGVAVRPRGRHRIRCRRRRVPGRRAQGKRRRSRSPHRRARPAGDLGPAAHGGGDAPAAPAPPRPGPVRRLEGVDVDAGLLEVLDGDPVAGAEDVGLAVVAAPPDVGGAAGGDGADEGEVVMVGAGTATARGAVRATSSSFAVSRSATDAASASHEPP